MDKHLNIRRIIIFLFIIMLLAVKGNARILPDPGSKEADSLKLVLAKDLTPKEKIKTLSALGKAYYNNSELDKALETEYELLDLVSKHGAKID